MPFKEGREYRMVSSPFAATEVGDDGAMWVEGYATTVDVPYDFGRDGLKECIRRSAIPLARSPAPFIHTSFISEVLSGDSGV